MQTGNTIYWHDYETFGSDPARDRPCQFAGLRTDEALNIIGDPLVIYCRPAEDVLPDPVACLVTGITPQKAMEKGLPEAEFASCIMQEFMQPGTCVAGYNSIRFDDEVSRHLFYRCLLDPYEREWKNGNSRWDIIDLLRLAHALRPEGIRWPQREDGNTSFRLEDLTKANGIAHEDAHDALSDVRATIALARLVKEQQPRLYDWYYQLRFKRKVQALLDLAEPELLLHVSSRYPASRGCMAVVLPLLLHPDNPNGVIVCDLAQDPSAWLDLAEDEIRHRLFSPAAILEAAGLERIALKTIHVNKSPALAPLSVLTEAVIKRYGIDLDQCRQHQAMLLREEYSKLAAVFRSGPDAGTQQDPELMLYSGGFISDSDRRLLNSLAGSDGETLKSQQPAFADTRLPELLFRYRCRNYPETLSADERQRWYAHCRERLLQPSPGSEDGRLDAIRQQVSGLLPAVAPHQRAILLHLQDYISALCQTLGLEN